MQNRFQAIQQAFTNLWTIGHQQGGQLIPCFDQKAITFAAAAANACEAAKLHDPTHELPALKRLADAGETLAEAELAYHHAERAWKNFAARHEADDSGHHDHQIKVGVARAALQAARQEHGFAVLDWKRAKGELPVAPAQVGAAA